jgi:hypothetical protein
MCEILQCIQHVASVLAKSTVQVIVAVYHHYARHCFTNYHSPETSAGLL